MVGHILLGIFLGIPSHIHKQLDRIFHWFQVTHIENPHSLDTEVVSQRELFKHLLSLSHVYPFAVAWSTYIVHMIVDSPSTFAVTLFLAYRYTSYITPVVVADKNQHIIGHTKSGIVVVLHFLVKRPHLSGFLSRFSSHFLDYPALILDNTFHQFGIGLIAHRLVTITTHTDSDNILSAFHSLYAFAEELVELGLVRLVVPRMIASHRFMVRRTHHHTHAVSQFPVLRIIGIESPRPHCRPHHIASQTENQFKYLLIEFTTAIACSEGILHPSRQARSFVVEEDTAEFHRWFTVSICAFHNECIIMFSYRCISPPIPG